MTDQVRVLDEVREFLSRRRNVYIDFLQAVERDLSSFRDRPNHRNVIYRIYSRKDKQLGADPLKTDWKIARKLGERRRTESSCAVHDIHDIVGVTVVTYFASQILTVVEDLCQPVMTGGLAAIDCEQKTEHGYHAVHLKVRRQEPRFHDLLGEIQVKTLLHDSWATKTHDLSYKPQGPTSSELVRQLALIGDALQLFERQADILRTLIEREWHRERRHRERAQREFLVAMTQDPKIAFDKEVADAARAIEADFNTLVTCPETDPVLTKHFDAWRSLVRKHGDKRQTCRLITLLAVLRETNDLDHVALDAIDSWIASITDKQERNHAMHFRALAAYSLGDLERAISQEREVIAFGLANNLPLKGARINLAFYLAESEFRGQNSDRDAARKEAESLVVGVLAEGISEDKKARYLDTQGIVAITFGNSEAEVREGLRLCREALEATPVDDPHRESLEAYCRLHEQRAWKRLSEEWP